MPVDTMKTRLMAARRDGSEVTGMSAIARELWRDGGYKAFYRGFMPAITRQAPSMLIQMPIIEFLRKQLGLDYL
jgi:solute carrier family 25 (mitochondrial citrate transporter), member 1